MSFGAGELVSVEHRGKIYRAKIVDTEGSRVKIHYVGWKPRWDEWIEGCSARIIVEALGDGDEMDVADEAVLRAELAAGGGVDSDRSVADLERSLELVIDSVQNSLDVGEDGVIPTSVIVGTSKRKRGHAQDSPEQSRAKRPSVQFDWPSAESSGDVGARSPLSVPGTVQPDISPQPVVVQSVPVCALCCSEVVGQVIRCGGCSRRFHPELLCLGVSESSITALLEATDGSITYKCCSCRVVSTGGGDSVSGEAMTQVLSIIGGLVAQVRSLTKDIGILRSSAPSVSGDRAGSRAAPFESSVMVEVREVYEREKRKASVVLRGLGDIPVDQVQGVFNRICGCLNMDNVSLTDIRKLTPSLFRATIVDSHKRFRVLSEAKKLRFSDDFARVFVQRDLTYQQRSELVARRAQNFSERSGSGPVPVGRLGAGVDGRGVSVFQGGVSRGRGGYGGVGRGSGGMGRGSGGRGSSGGGLGSVGRGSGGRGRGSGFGDRGRGSGGRGNGSDNFGGRGGGSGAGGNAFNANHQTRNLNC